MAKSSVNTNPNSSTTPTSTVIPLQVAASLHARRRSNGQKSLVVAYGTTRLCLVKGCEMVAILVTAYDRREKQK